MVERSCWYQPKTRLSSTTGPTILSTKESHSSVDVSVVLWNSFYGTRYKRVAPRLVNPQTEWANYPCDMALILADSSRHKTCKREGERERGHSHIQKKMLCEQSLPPISLPTKVNSENAWLRYKCSRCQISRQPNQMHSGEPKVTAGDIIVRGAKF